MNKTKLIAISAMCSVVALVCLLLAPFANWAILMLGVIASVAVAIPMLINPKYLGYSVMVYFVASVLCVLLGFANIVYVAPIVIFCMPFAIVKVHGDAFKVTAEVVNEQVLENPFDIEDDKKVVSVKVDGKRQLNKVVQWILYYLLLEAGIGLTMLSAYLFAKPLFDTFVGSKLFWVVLAIMQSVVYPYNILMNGCLLGTTKILHKALRNH